MVAYSTLGHKLSPTYLQATKSTLERFGLRPDMLQVAPTATSRLGNWTVNYVPILDRHAYLFMSDRTFFNFPILQGKNKIELEDMPGFLQHGISKLLESFGVSEEMIAGFLSDFEEIAVTRVQDKSSLAMHAAIVADYAHVLRKGGSAGQNLSEAIIRVNNLPRRKLAWATSIEATLSLLASSVA
jgi:hypothetical protein